MSDEKRKPCGEYHPLPCGVDRECGYVTREEELRELVEKWRDNIVMTGFDREIAQRNRTFTECADDLEAVISSNAEDA